MAHIYYNYDFHHKCSNSMGWMGKWSHSIAIKSDEEHISSLIKRSKSIDELIDIIRINSKILEKDFSRFAYFYFEVCINGQDTILSHNLKILTAEDIEREQEDIEREKFEPYIKYDIDDVREGTIKPIECLLIECNSTKEQIELIEHYLGRPHRRFSKWSTKPNKLFLYHTYGESPKEFRISFD